jgi:predicted membrane protein
MNIFNKHNLEKILFIFATIGLFACSSRKGNRDPLSTAKVEAIAIENHAKILREQNGYEPSPIELHDYIIRTKSGDEWLNLWTFYPNDKNVIAIKHNVIKMSGKGVDVKLMRDGRILEIKAF